MADNRASEISPPIRPTYPDSEPLAVREMKRLVEEYPLNPMDVIWKRRELKPEDCPPDSWYLIDSDQQYEPDWEAMGLPSPPTNSPASPAVDIHAKIGAV